MNTGSDDDKPSEQVHKEEDDTVPQSATYFGNQRVYKEGEEPPEDTYIPWVPVFPDDPDVFPVCFTLVSMA